MDSMIGGVGEKAEEERESKGREKRKGEKYDWPGEGKQRKAQVVTFPRLVVPANYLLAALSLVIPLPVYHHSLCRWEQSVTI